MKVYLLISKTALIISVAVFMTVLNIPSFADKIKASKNNESLMREANHTLDKGLAFLKTKQNPDGYWSTSDYPAITGLVIYAFLNSDKYGAGKERPDFIQRGIDFIIQNIKPDGGIYKADLPNYNTSICMMALIATKDPQYNPILLKARNYLPTLQLDKKEKGETDTIYNGGIGYGTKDHSDMSNTYIALEALKMSQFLKAESKKEMFAKNLNWQAALKFVQRCQNLTSTNDQSWASDDSLNKGGFIYFPGNSKAGEQKLENGQTALRSYGSMTYAGLLSLIYADVKKDDERIQAAYSWLIKNYTLKENPGAGQQGLYFYYHTMAKALTVYGKDYLYTADGKKINWREELVSKLIEKQKGEGFWVNNNGRWWENDPVLVTAYSLIALNMVIPFL
jgi:squalene-hopene/tetraprenyl-beta-curcumene cyclase